MHITIIFDLFNSSLDLPQCPLCSTVDVAMTGLRFLLYSSLILGCQSLSDFVCSSTLRKSLFQPSVPLPVPLLGAEVDVLMQRRNTKVGNIYSTHDELYNERLAKSVYCGRNDVEAAIKAIQRFTLQLDRSDGRPDLELTTVAQKFNDFVSICLRTDGPAWTAAIGPLDYLGLKIQKFRRKELDQQTNRILFETPKLCVDVATRLLDLQVSQIEDSLNASEENKCAVWNLNFVVARMALRYTMFENELEGLAVDGNTDTSLHIAYADDTSALIAQPPPYVLESILSLDFCVDYTIDSASKCFVIGGDELAAWKNKNRLSS